VTNVRYFFNFSEQKGCQNEKRAYIIALSDFNVLVLLTLKSDKKYRFKEWYEWLNWNGGT
jgi:hypothetical protein